MTDAMASVIDDPYRELGVRSGAAAQEIKHAYRGLARALHPDVNPDPGARERFTNVSSAYALLSDPVRRAACDLAHISSPTPPPPCAASADEVSDVDDLDYVPVVDDGAETPIPEPPPPPPRQTRPAPARHVPPGPAGTGRGQGEPSWCPAVTGLLWPRGWPAGRIEHMGWLVPVALALWWIAPLPRGGAKLLVIVGWLVGGYWAGSDLLALAPAATHATADVSVTVLWLLPLGIWALRGLVCGYLGIVRAAYTVRRIARRARSRWPSTTTGDGAGPVRSAGGR